MPNGKFKPTYYVTAYQLARDGQTDGQIGKILGVSYPTFRSWLKKDPVLKDAVNRGRGKQGSGNEKTFQEYVYDHLPSHLRKLWDEIHECDVAEDREGHEKTLCKINGKREKQQLFLYAFTQGLFNISAALRKLGIPKRTFETWRHDDPEFAELMNQMHEHKKDFIEGAYLRRVDAGDTAAVLHGVKTLCRDRGYNEKIEVVHSGAIENKHSFNLTELEPYLDAENLRALLDAVRAKQKADIQAEKGTK